MTCKLDIHVHITSPDVIANWKRYAALDEHFNLLCSSPQNRFATAEDVITKLDEQGLDAAVVFGFAFKDQALCRETNSYVIDAVKRYSKRLIGFACVNPTAKGLEAELSRCVAGGLTGVGELMPDGQGYEIDDPKQTAELAGLCKEGGLPVLVHVNEPVGHYYPGKTKTSIEEACAFAEANPELKIIYAHWGGGLLFYELMPELKQVLKNVYYDTAAGPFLYSPKIYEAVLSAGLIHKVLLGSDYPLLSPGRYIKELGQTALSEADKNRIMGGNAHKLLERG